MNDEMDDELNDETADGTDDALDARLERMETYKGLIEHDHLTFLTPASPQDELEWAAFAKECLACGRTQSDCELTWEIDEEFLDDNGQIPLDRDILCRPRRWICAFDTKACTRRVLCPSCYQLIRFDCIEGVWDPEFMIPARLQMILPFADTETGAVLLQ